MNREKLAVYGAGGHGKVVADIAAEAGYKDIVFIDDGDNDFITYDEFKKLYSDIPVALGIGNNHDRKKVYKKIINDSLNLLTLVHPSSVLSRSVRLGAGSVVMAGVVVNADVFTGCAVILNSLCAVEHDCRIGDFVHISPCAGIGGNVEIGELSHIGLGASVVNSIKIGKESIIGAGSTVIQDVGDCVTSVGSPAKVIKRHECG